MMIEGGVGLLEQCLRQACLFCLLNDSLVSDSITKKFNAQ